MRPITTRIVGKFQTTVPPEIREIFGLEEGDLLEWMFDEASQEIRLVAKRPQLITPQALELANKSRDARRSAAAGLSRGTAVGTRTAALEK
ncbi:MAG: AbrB/MazE/SpoVT family DNA-binding domain-containing protein [Bryobacteraceae bacterium]|jgi:bifunctional DNA-binding transcriptional regulator/antitoxin component of YhaV-PrlF toxin-antitoxin module